MGTELAVARKPLRIRLASEAPPDRHKIGLMKHVSYALYHPWHVVVLAGATVFGVANWSVAILLAVFFFVEGLTLAIVLRLGAFRDYVANKELSIRKRAASEERATLLLQITEEHRRKVLVLEQVLDRIREVMSSPLGTVEQMMLDECAQLIALFVQYSIAYKRLSVSISNVNRRDLDTTIDRIKQSAVARTPQLGYLYEQHLAILQQRVSQWDEGRLALDEIGQQLVLIEEVLLLTSQRAHMPKLRAENSLRAALDDIDVSQHTLDEMQTIDIADVDAEMLSLGRASA